MTYIAIIQLMGIKDKSHYDLMSFNKILTYDFPRISQETTENFQNCNVITLLDYCICESAELNVVIQYSVKLRQSLIEDIDVLCRGYVSHSDRNILNEGELKLIDFSDENMPQNSSFRGYQFEKDSRAISVLFAEISRLKGLSIKVDEELIKNNPELTSSVFTNFYIEHYNTEIINSFYDLKFDTEELEQTEVDKIFKNFEKSNYWSPRFVTFFIPLINNLIYSWGAFDTESSKESPYTITNIISSGYFNKYQKIRGINIVLLFFIKQRILLDSGDTISKFPEILNALKKNNRLMALLRKDSIIEIPSQLFDYRNKYKFLSIIYPKD